MNGGTHAGNLNTFGNTVVSLLRCKELCFDLPITIHMQGASLFLSQCNIFSALPSQCSSLMIRLFPELLF